MRTITDLPIRTRPRHLVGGLVLFAMVLVVAVPVAAVVIRSFGLSDPASVGPSAAWTRMLGSARTWRIFGVTVLQAAASALVTAVVGVGIAYVLARFRFPGRSLVRTLVTVPFVLPSVVVGAAFASLFGPAGFFEARGSWWLIIAAHLCFNLAVVTRTVGAAFTRLDHDSEAAARLLGRSRSGTFFGVLLPQVAPSIAASAVIVFMFCLTSFGVIVLLGGGPVTTIEVEIWTRATRQFDLSGAAVLSALQLVAVLATLTLDSVVGRRVATVVERRRANASAPADSAEWTLVATSVAAVLVISGLPLGALVLRSLQVPGGFGIENWSRLGSVLQGTALRVSPLNATLNSLSFALMATVIALVLALPVSRYIANRSGRVAQSIVLVPLGVSATTIGLGLLIAFGRPPIDLRSSGWLIPAAQVLVAMPLVTRVLVPPTRSVDPSVLDAAAVLGAGARQRLWRVELPMLRTAILAAAGLGFVACLGEFGATVFVTRTDRTTMPVLLERLMSRPGGAGYGQAMALGVVMVVVCGVVLTIADRLGQRDGTELSVI